MKAITTTVASLALLTHAWAAKDVDLTKFDGNYKGNGVLTVEGKPYVLTANAKIDVARNGATANVKLSGKVNAGVVVPWGTVYTLKRNGRLTVSDVISVEAKLGPASGTYKLKKGSKIETRTKPLPFDTVLISQEAKISVKPRGRKKHLDVVLTVLVDGQAVYFFNVKLTGRSSG